MFRCNDRGKTISVPTCEVAGILELILSKEKGSTLCLGGGGGGPQMFLSSDMRVRGLHHKLHKLKDENI